MDATQLFDMIRSAPLFAPLALILLVLYQHQQEQRRLAEMMRDHDFISALNEPPPPKPAKRKRCAYCGVAGGQVGHCASCGAATGD